ncbi:MAG: peptidylprolyl isomerase [Acetobacterales bacterium]
MAPSTLFTFLMRLLLVPLLSALIGLVPTGRLQAQETQRIAAIVNDDVISVQDLSARVSLTILASGLRDSTEIRSRLTPAVLRSLIDERLQLQEAGRLGISVDDSEIARSLREIEQRNNMPPGQLAGVLNSAGIGITAMIDQIRAGLMWRNVVQRVVAPRVRVTPEDIDEVANRIKANAGQQEYLVSEIFLPVEGRDQREDIEALAQNLMGELRRGAAFPALATMFSQSSSAQDGGDIGWVQQGQLPREIDTALRDMDPGTISPVSTAPGVYLILLRDEREIGAAVPGAMPLAHVFLPIESGADDEQAKVQMDRLARVTEQARGCADMTRMADELDSPRPGELGRVRPETLPAPAREALGKVQTGEPTAPTRISGGAAVFMACDSADGGPDRDLIRRQLENERIATQARRHLRNLRQQAFLDVRT